MLTVPAATALAPAPTYKADRLTERILPLGLLQVAGMRIVIHAGIDGWQKYAAASCRRAAASRMRVRAILRSGFCTPARLSAVVRSIGWTSSLQDRGRRSRRGAIPLAPLAAAADLAAARGRRDQEERLECYQEAGPENGGLVCAQPAGWVIQHDADDDRQRCPDDLPDPLHRGLLLLRNGTRCVPIRRLMARHRPENLANLTIILTSGHDG